MAHARRRCRAQGHLAPARRANRVAPDVLPAPPKMAHKRLLFPAKKPDLDKLIRATGDALSTILYVDDAQIVYFEVRKVFATAERTPGLDLEAWLE